MEGAPLTSTSNLGQAVQPQYATYSAVSNQFRRMRSAMFKSASRPNPATDIAVSSRFVPKAAGPLDGFDSQKKAMIGMGEFVVDPMQGFGMSKLELNGRSYSSKVNRIEPRNEGNRFRSRGISAYRRSL